ncbi:MAG: glycosyltransferase, partial [Acidimicrobiales bacterium]
VSTFNRPHNLPGLVAALEKQDLDPDEFELIVVDNGSGPPTWEALAELVGASARRALGARLEVNRGPGGGRNAGVALARAPLVAFTDDDCLPTPGWLPALLHTFEENPHVEVVQGRVAPDPEGVAAAGPWDHTVDIGGQTPWFETCDVAYRSSALARVGGFDESDELTGRGEGGRAFGEDAVLAWKVLQSGGEAAFVPEALVHHRVVPATFQKTLSEWRHFQGFPGLVKRSGVVRDSLFLGLFLNRQTARFDLALVGIAGALITRRPVLAVAALPWLRWRWPVARRQAGGTREALVLLAQRGAIEGVGLASLIEGSARHRRLVL